MLPHCSSIDADVLLKCVESGNMEKMQVMLNEFCREHRLSIRLCKQLLLVAERTDQISMIKLLLEHDTRNSQYFHDKKLSALWIAILYGYEKSAELLVLSGSVDLNEPLGIKFQHISDGESTVLHALLQMSNPFWAERFFALVVDCGADLQARDSRGRTPLHCAVSRGNVKMTELLLKKRADVNARDNEGDTALLMAAKSSKAEELLPLLIRYRADVTAKNSRGCNVLYNLTKNFGERIDLATFLIEKGALLNGCRDQHNMYSFEPLRQAISSNKYELVRLYLNNGAELENRDSFGQTPLHYAVTKGQVQVTEWLLEKGAVVNVADNFGETPLLAAAGTYEADILLPLLIRYGADVRAKNSRGCNVLYYLTKTFAQRVDLAKFLIEKGAWLNNDRDQRVCIRNRPLHGAIINRKYELAKLFLDHGAEVNDRDPVGRTILHCAVGEYYNIKLTEWLLEKGADVNAVDNNGETPLLTSVRTGYRTDKFLPLLMKHGANINVADNNGETPLLAAAKSGKANKLLSLVMKHGADVTARDSQGRNALHLLTFAPLGCEKVRIDLARLLIDKGVVPNDSRLPYQLIRAAIFLNRNELVNLYLDHGVDVNSLTDDDHSLLQLATDHKMPTVLETLLDRDANVDLRTDKGRTALHYACQKSRPQSIRILLKTGVNMLVEDQDGNTPFALIEVKNINNPCIRLMLQKLALKKASHPSIELKDERIIEKHPELQGYYKDCFAEIDKMKSMRLTDTCSVFDLLAKSHCEISELMRDSEFRINFKHHDLDKLSIYRDNHNILRGFERAKSYDCS